MSNKDQAIKNMDLSQELAEFIAQNPKVVKNVPKSSTYVAFSSSDEGLNKANEKLISSLVKEGKRVIKAIQTNDKFNPWKFFPATSI